MGKGDGGRKKEGSGRERDKGREGEGVRVTGIEGETGTGREGKMALTLCKILRVFQSWLGGLATLVASCVTMDSRASASGRCRPLLPRIMRGFLADERF